MINIEQVTYDVLSVSAPGIQWSAEYPQEFAKHGVITQMDNSVNITSSKLLDHMSRVAVQIQFWTETPEARNIVDTQVDTAMQQIGLLRGSPNHLTDIRDDGTALYRSVLLYNGVYDNNTNTFYRR